MAVTIKDVAKETNLAISTISKYMNGGQVRPYNKKRIEEAIAKLGYHPNDLARGLRSSKTYTIGVLIDSLESKYFALIVSMIEKVLKKEGYSIILCCHRNNSILLKKAIRFLMEKRIDGVVLGGLINEKIDILELESKKIPLVVVDSAPCCFDCDNVSVNSAAGSYQAVEYLVRQGHKKIAIITGTNLNNISTAKERLKGYLRVLEDYELPIYNEYIKQGDYFFSSGYKALQQLWQTKEHPSALFISNYNMCLGAITAIGNLKIKIPEELSIVTFDDMEFSIICKPNLTAVRQPIEQIAKETAYLLLKRIEGDYTGFPKKIKMPTQLIIRDSVAKID